MIGKIPFSSINNPPSSEVEQKIIKCSLCDGILYEPVYSIKNKLNYCKNCFLEKNNNNSYNNENNYSHPYHACSKQIKNNLNLYKYTCPNFDFEEKLYTYDELINHLIACENNKIYCPSCGAETFIKKKKKEKQTIKINKEKEKVKKIPKEVIPKIKKEKIIINAKSSSNKLFIKPKRPFSKKNEIRKGELPPVRKKSKVFTKKEEPPPKLNFNIKLNIKERPKETIIDNSGNTTLFDKCPHFYGNYMPKFACCNKFYGCYLCHNENEDHPYKFSNKVACLFCKNVYPGKTCTKCKANQIFKRKKFF